MSVAKPPVRYELCVAISIVTNCLVKDSPPLTRFPSNIEVQKGRKKPKKKRSYTSSTPSVSFGNSKKLEQKEEGKEND